MGAKLGEAGRLNVPGPGSYNQKGSLESLEKATKFGTGQRSNLGINFNKSPGPGEHDGDYKKVFKQAPIFGFGSESRNSNGVRNLGPGPGGYHLKNIIGNEGHHNTMHSTINYSPEKKENSYKPGPG